MVAHGKIEYGKTMCKTVVYRKAKYEKANENGIF